jgi:sec-independent protein translocase protein TatC
MNDQSRTGLDETKAPLIEHLIELRKRLIWSILAFFAAFLVSFYYAEYIFGFLVAPLTDSFAAGEGKLIYTKLYEAFFVEMKVAMFAAFFVAFPVIANQIWAFVAPGLYANEKKAFLPFIVATPVLFIAGAALAYYLVMPLAFTFFLNFQGTTGGLEFEALPAAGDYLSLVMQFILAFGICFQLPVLMILLHRAGLVTLDQMKGLRRYMIVVIFAVAAILTPPDVISQLMLGLPLVLLYEISVQIIAFGERRKKKSEIS